MNRKVQSETCRMPASSGSLFMRTWTPEEAPKAVVALVHGIAEHSGRYQHVAKFLAGKGYAVAAADLRGHGKSPGRRAYADRFEAYADDAAGLLDAVQKRFPGLPVFLLGHSMGGAVATLFALTKPHNLRGMVLSGAALKISDSISPLLQSIAGIAGKLFPKLTTVKLDESGLSRDAEVIRQYKNDPLCYTGGTLARTAAEVIRISKFFQNRMHDFTLPVLILHGGADRITDPSGSHMLHKKAASTDKTLKIYDGLLHEIMNEPEKYAVLQDISTWLDARCA